MKRADTDPVVTAVRTLLARAAPADRVRIAFSGGVDSTALLHAAAQSELGTRLAAVHVHHGLQAEADVWAAHCAAVAAALAVPFELLRVEVEAAEPDGPEAAARDARYAALAASMQDGELLLTAQHRDDQAETLLLQLLRGAGPAGLAAMPALRPFACGQLGRPLLALSRAELLGWLAERGLHAIDDPSNFDDSYDRNWIRNQLLPMLALRRAGVAAALARSARLQGEAAGLVDELAAMDAQATVSDGKVDIAALLRLSVPRQRNLLRYWLRIQGVRMPSEKVLQRALDEVCAAAADAVPEVSWGGTALRRHRGQLMLGTAEADDTTARIAWSVRAPLRLKHGCLSAHRVVGQGVSAALLGDGVEVRFRVGGERCRLHTGGPSRTLKNLFQEWRVPSWQRAGVPLLYVHDELAAVAGYCVCAPFAAAASDSGVVFDWHVYD